MSQAGARTQEQRDKLARYMRERGIKQTALGLCRNHSKERALPGLRHCQRCEDSQQKHRDRKKILGHCARHLDRQAIEGKTLCAECCETVKNDRLKRAYGLTTAAKTAMVEAQSGVCAICKGDFACKACVDHNHDTGKVRGILCNQCNRVLGMMKEDAQALRSAADYLDFWSKQHGGA